MKIKTRIIGIVIFGITLLFGVSFYSTQEINYANREYSAQESIIAHSSAWTSNMDVEFTDKLYVYDPLYGSDQNIAYWDYSSEDPFGAGDLQNPLHIAFVEKDGVKILDLLSSVFLSPIETEQLTFAIAYDNRGLQLYCESSLYVVGIDPCSESASPDYFLNFGAFVRSIEKGPSRRTVLITDVDEEKPVSVNDTYSFALLDESDSAVGVIVLGRNITESLEVFAENFEVETALVVGDQVITVGDYFDEERSEELTLLIRDSILHSEAKNEYEYSYISEELKSRISSIPLSKSIRASELRILLFDDQSELLGTLKTSERQAQIVFGGMALLILALSFIVTSASFNRILEAIGALERMGEGDLSENKLSRGWFSSNYDEVGRLQKAINEYRLHRVEAEVQRKERAKRRDERDEIMFEKMAILSDQLEGEARTLLTQEIKDMRTALSSGSDEEKERASIEVMSKAFSKMSDEGEHANRCTHQ
jgi:hypothetical protein